MGKGITRNLLERRVPQYLAAYLAGSWVMVEFFAFLEERFLLSPHLTNLVLLLLLLMLPSVALFTWYHGRRGPDEWRRAEKIFIPINGLVTIGILAALFAGRDLGAMTTTVTVEDPEGNAVERVVPKSEFRKSLVMFPFEVEAGGDDAIALAFGALKVLSIDMVQDMFIDLRPVALYRDKARAAGYEVSEVPRPLKRRLTREIDLEYFTDGTFSYDGAVFRFSVLLHDAVRGGLVAERSYEGTDLLALIDEAAVQLREDLDLPARYVDNGLDMPARDHATASIEALQAFGEADWLLFERDDFDGARAALRRAVELDPTFAAAAFSLYQLSVLSGEVPAAQAAIRTTMDHLYRMPERFQFAVRAEWYAMQRDLPKAFAVYEMWAELYPQDLDAQLYTAQVRSFQGDREGSLEAFEKALALDPTRLDIVEQVGELNEQLGRPDAARVAYERIVREQPDQPGGFIQLAELESRVGNHEAARSLYERASLVTSENVGVITGLAELHADLGEFEAAEAALELAMAAAKTPEQRFTVLRSIRRYHAYRADFDRALDYQQQTEEAGAEFQPPIANIQYRLLGLRAFVRAGRADEALQRLDSLAAQMQAPMDALVPIGRIAVYETLEDADALAAALDDARNMLERTGLNMLERDILFGQGRLHEIRGEWQQALAAYREELRLSPTDINIPQQLGRIYRALGDLNAAEEQLRATLTAQPSHGRANYELALVQAEQGRPAEAIRSLERALETWANPTGDYPFPALAREKLAALRDAR